MKRNVFLDQRCFKLLINTFFMITYDYLLKPILAETEVVHRKIRKMQVVSCKLAIYNISVYPSMDDSDHSFS